MDKAKIDRIFVVTLRETEFRRGLCTGHLLARGVPEDIIDYHYGHNGNDFPSTIEVCEAAKSDGFKMFDEVLDNETHRDLNQNIVAQYWSYMIMCREALERNETIAWFHDDYGILPEHRWSDVLYMVENIGKFDFILLDYHSKSTSHPDYETSLQKETDIQTFGNIRVSKGILGRHDQSIIVSPSGAQWLLEHTKFSPRDPAQPIFTGRYSFEGMISYLGLFQDLQTPGMFTCSPGIASMITRFSIVGSNIHNVETLINENRWEVLNPSYWQKKAMLKSS